MSSILSELLSARYELYAEFTKNKEYSGNKHAIGEADEYVISKATHKHLKKGISNIFQYFDASWYAIRPSNLTDGQKKFQKAKELFEKGNPCESQSEHILKCVTKEMMENNPFYRIGKDPKMQEWILLSAFEID